jgi:hypothetical protein
MTSLFRDSCQDQAYVNYWIVSAVKLFFNTGGFSAGSTATIILPTDDEADCVPCETPLLVLGRNPNGFDGIKESKPGLTELSKLFLYFLVPVFPRGTHNSCSRLTMTGSILFFLASGFLCS